MSTAPDAGLLARIRAAAEQVAAVREVEDIKGHFVGTFVHVELTARVDGALSTHESHDVGEAVQRSVEAIEVVDRAFVHIEPVAMATATGDRECDRL